MVPCVQHGRRVLFSTHISHGKHTEVPVADGNIPVLPNLKGE